MNRLAFCNSIMLLVDIDFTIVAYVLVKSRFTEYYCAMEFVFLQVLIFFVNLAEDLQFEWNNTFEEATLIIYYIILSLNMLTILLTILGGIFLFIYKLIRECRHQNEINLNRGLTYEEINKLDVYSYKDLVKRHPSIIKENIDSPII